MKFVACSLISSCLIGLCLITGGINTNSIDSIQTSDCHEYVINTLMPSVSDETLACVEEPEPEETTTEDIVEDIPCSYLSVTEEERELLARIVYLEAGICSIECQRGIASVILNRLESNKWVIDVDENGQITIYDIIYYPDAFSPAYLIPETTPSQSCYDAVDYVICNGTTLPPEVRYFRINYDFTWTNYKNYCIIDTVHFGYFTNWKEGAW